MMGVVDSDLGQRGRRRTHASFKSVHDAENVMGVADSDVESLNWIGSAQASEIPCLASGQYGRPKVIGVADLMWRALIVTRILDPCFGSDQYGRPKLP